MSSLLRTKPPILEETYYIGNISVPFEPTAAITKGLVSHQLPPAHSTPGGTHRLQRHTHDALAGLWADIPVCGQPRHTEVDQGGTMFFFFNIWNSLNMYYFTLWIISVWTASGLIYRTVLLGGLYDATRAITQYNCLTSMSILYVMEEANIHTYIYIQRIMEVLMWDVSTGRSGISITFPWCSWISLFDNSIQHLGTLHLMAPLVLRFLCRYGTSYWLLWHSCKYIVIFFPQGVYAPIVPPFGIILTVTVILDLYNRLGIGDCMYLNISFWSYYTTLHDR